MLKNYGWILINILIMFFYCAPRQIKKSDDLNTYKLQMQKNKINTTYNLLIAADSLYKSKNYQQAIKYYLSVQNKSNHIIAKPEYYFKIGYSYYLLQKTDSAILWMKKSYKDKKFQFRDYTSLLLSQSYWLKNNNTETLYYLKSCVTITKNEYLKAKAYWKIVEVLKKQKSDSVGYYLKKVKFRKLLNRKEDFIRLKLSLLKKNQDPYLIKFSQQMLQYDWHSELEDSLFAVLINKNKNISILNKISILSKLINKPEKKYFYNWYNLLKRTSNLNSKQKAQIAFIKAIKLYKEKKWQSCFQQLKSIKSKRLPAKMKGDYSLYLARCYARQGFQNSAIKAYYKFQKKYPKHKLAGDALWWIALTFEQKNDFRSAEKYYNILGKKYFSKEVGKEARFRILFNNIKRRMYSKALRSISKLVKKVDYNDQVRLNYWKMHCLKKIGKYKDANNVKKKLLEDPFQNYYSLKTFLLENKDSLKYFREYAPYKTPSPYQLDEKLWNKIDKILLIEEILGEEFAQIELKSIFKNKNSSKIYKLIISEINSQLGNYGEAFKQNRRNYARYFSKKRWSEKIGFIKKLYPLYYDKLIFPAANNKNVDPLLVYALIKRESLFQKEVKSYANAYGLMQILPSTAKRLSRSMKNSNYNEPVDLYNPEININLGIHYLEKLLKDFNGSIPQVLASYNAGESRVKRWEKRYLVKDDLEIFTELIPISQTRNYVKYILYYYYVYQWFYRLEEGFVFYKQRPVYPYKDKI